MEQTTAMPLSKRACPAIIMTTAMPIPPRRPPKAAHRRYELRCSTAGGQSGFVLTG
jgi:hypothetical protein